MTRLDSRSGWGGVGLWICLAGAALVRSAGAQTLGRELQLADRGTDRGPLFVSVPSRTTAERTDMSRAAVLRQRVSLTLIAVSLEDALTTIGRQVGLRFTFSRATAPLDRRVSLRADDITVAAALTEILFDTGVDVELSPDGRAALIRHTDLLAPVTTRVGRQQGRGTIAGRVIDAVTQSPLDQVAVHIEGQGLRSVTGADGRYTVRDVPLGTYRVTARRVGYTLLTRTVTVTADSGVTADFVLAAAATTLNEVVTTAVGDQRRIELGNAVATINVDSLARTAPITQMTDILSGRVPGVEVLEQQGQVGAGPRIRIRGLSSFSVSNDPIIYVDGVRVDGSAGGLNGAAPLSYTTYPTPSRLNDIDPADIESIDVLKGPSAATEYGTDAANGVIVIKTKGGHAGAPQWDFHVEHGLSNVPASSHFEIPWMGWGHTTDGSNTPVTCPRTFGFGPTVANGGCVVDSVTTYQPLDHAATTIFGTGTASRIGAQVSGGVQQFRYFLAGATENTTGVLQLPPFERQQVADRGQAVPGYVQRPNTLDATNVRGRVAVALGSTTDIGFSTAYISNRQRSANDGLPIAVAVTGPGYRDSLYRGYGGAGFGDPANTFALEGSQAMHRFAGSANGAWRPTPWLTTRGVAGIDLGNRTDEGFQAPGPDPDFVTSFPGSSGTGYHGINRITTTLYTVDLGATAIAPLSRAVTSKTSVGLQYNARRETGALAQAYGLTANGSLNGASVYVASQIDSEAKTVGSYVEESMSWRDRLFLTGAARVDAGSGFGSQVNSAVYPKASMSWAAVETPGSRLRLRAAYGESGVQPPSGATLSLYAPVTVAGAGGSVSGDTATVVANPRLKPERSAELEAGMDAGIWNDRVALELTYYHKQTRNTIVANVLPGSNGGSVEYENLGSVLNYGIEGSLTIQVLTARQLGWDVTLGGSINQNRLKSLPSGQPPITAPDYPFFLQYQQAVGYPLFGYWAPRLQYIDANRDGIIEPSEVSETSTFFYQGSSIPTKELTLNNGVALFNRAVRIASQVEYRGGYKIENYLKRSYELGPNAAGFNDSHAALSDQARAVEESKTAFPLTNAYFDDGTFVRWRELSVTYVLPDRLTRAFHARAASVTALGRNLALWTRYTGADPEVTTGFTAGAPPDGVYDFGVTPQVRSWALRLNVGL